MSSSKELQCGPSSWAALLLSPMSQIRTLFERWLDSCDLEKRSYVPHSRPGPHGDLGYAPRVELKDSMQATQGAPRG